MSQVSRWRLHPGTFASLPNPSDDSSSLWRHWTGILRHRPQSQRMTVTQWLIHQEWPLEMLSYFTLMNPFSTSIDQIGSKSRHHNNACKTLSTRPTEAWSRRTSDAIPPSRKSSSTVQIKFKTSQFGNVQCDWPVTGDLFNLTKCIRGSQRPEKVSSRWSPASSQIADAQKPWATNWRRKSKQGHWQDNTVHTNITFRLERQQHLEWQYNGRVSHWN
jgi:hypothetical protein